MGWFFFNDGLFDLFFMVFFFLIVGIILIAVITGIKEWNDNNRSPRLDVDATVRAKRMSTSGSTETSRMTSYYATFEVESGDRMEFSLSGREYGTLAEGDFGKLSFQGSRYLGFLRK